MKIRNSTYEEGLYDEPEFETCDVYANHGDPSGDSHHGCLDQLLDGDEFSIADIQTIPSGPLVTALENTMLSYLSKNLISSEEYMIFSEKATDPTIRGYRSRFDNFVKKWYSASKVSGAEAGAKAAKAYISDLSKL